MNLVVLALCLGSMSVEPQYSIEPLVEGASTLITRFTSTGNYFHFGNGGAGVVIGGRSTQIPMYYTVWKGPSSPTTRGLTAVEVCNDGFWFGMYQGDDLDQGFAVPSGNRFTEFRLPVRPAGLLGDTTANSRHEVAFTGQLLGYKKNPPEFAYRFSFANGRAEGLPLGSVGAIGSAAQGIDESGNIAGFLRKAGNPNGPGPWKGYNASPVLWLKDNELKLLPVPEGCNSAAAMGLWSKDLTWGCGWSDKAMKFAIWKEDKLSDALSIDKGLIDPFASRCKTDGTPVLTATKGKVSKVWQRVDGEWVNIEELVKDPPTGIHLDSLVAITDRNWLLVLGKRGSNAMYYLLKPLE